MKSWRETSEIFHEASRFLAAGEPVALATVVRLEGSCCRRVGWRMLFRRDGAIIGPSSGGRLERDLRDRAIRMINGNDGPELIEYGTHSHENVLWGLGMEPNGRIDVFLQVLSPPPDPVLEEIKCRFSGIDSFAIRTVLDGRDAGEISVGPPFTDGRSGIVIENSERIFVHHLDSPPHLVVVGAGEDAIPLVRIANDVGFRVTVVDHREEALSAANFPSARALVLSRPDAPSEAIPLNVQTFALLMYHDPALNEAWCRVFAQTAVPYIGVVRRGARASGWVDQLPPEVRARVRDPAGLEIGAENPEQTAISVIAECLACESGLLTAESRHPSAITQ